jgi:hypothetical protein
MKPSAVGTTPKSTSSEPDLDWSQVRETILMLNLATARIEYCMRDGDDSVNALANSFTNMAGHVAAIRSALDQVWEKGDAPKELKEGVIGNCEDISSKMHNAIMAFQFYDKLVQRLAHISRSMSALASLVSDPVRLYSPFEWKGLQEKIRSQYSMSDEIKMFDAVLEGASIEEIVKLMETHENNRKENDVELF